MRRLQVAKGAKLVVSCRLLAVLLHLSAEAAPMIDVERKHLSGCTGPQISPSHLCPPVNTHRSLFMRFRFYTDTLHIPQKTAGDTLPELAQALEASASVVMIMQLGF